MGRAFVPVMGVVVAVVLVGGIVAFALLIKPAPQPLPAPQPQDAPFPEEQFFLTFDANRDGVILQDEFVQAYDSEANTLRFNRAPGEPLLDAVEAFQFLDRNRDGRIDGSDHKAAHDKAWVKFRADVRARGFNPKVWNNLWYMLNDHQNDVLDKEIGAKGSKQLPFAGAFFDAKYFEPLRFVRLGRAEPAEGFLWQDPEDAGSLRLVSTHGRLLVIKPAESFTELPEAPQVRYIQRVRELALDDTAGNLALAQDCVSWGMPREAGMMFARVLVFAPENEAALAALNLRNEGGKFLPREK